MTWTAGSDRATGDVITAAQWNNFLGSAGNITLTAPGVVTTEGDTVYATAANTLARLAKGTGRQSLSMNSGGTAPEWVASPASTLTTTGDILYASSANTIARLAASTDGYVLTATGAGSAPAWEANPAPASTIPTTSAGDILYASSSNTLAGLTKGTALQGLTMNSGATAPEWTASPASVLTATGDVLYASGANTLARLAASTDGYVLTATGAGSAPAWEAVPSSWVVTSKDDAEYSITGVTTLTTVKQYTGLNIPANAYVQIRFSMKGSGGTVNAFPTEAELWLGGTKVETFSGTAWVPVRYYDVTPHWSTGGYNEWDIAHHQISLGPRSGNYNSGHWEKKVSGVRVFPGTGSSYVEGPVAQVIQAIGRVALVPTTDPITTMEIKVQPVQTGQTTTISNLLILVLEM